MKNALALTLILLCHSHAQADDFDADVCYLTGGGYGVRIVGSTICYRPVFSDSVADEDFQNLFPGDNVAFSGSLTTDQTFITIDSIAAVSLNRLLGEWIDAKNRYYNFVDYSNLVVYDRVGTNIITAETYNYELYPNSSFRWGIALTSQHSNNVGLLREFIDGSGVLHFEICIYQNNTPARKRVCSTLTRLTN